ncbi:MAG: hypothetical protein WCF23_22240 [Candidatus Nitrosopolaris sp.]
MLTQINDNKDTKLVLPARLWMLFSPRFTFFLFSLPKRSQKKSAEYQDPIRAIATMVFPRGAWSTNAVTKEIAAPIRLNGSHFLIAR